MKVFVRVSPPATVRGLIGGQVGRSYTQRGVITVGDDRRVVYCPEPDLSNILSFQFDGAFDELAATTAVYQNAVLPLVQATLGGQSSTAIVCGEDAFGKAMLMEGQPGQLVPGFISLAAESIFAGLQYGSVTDGAGCVKVVRVSCFELGRGGARDLLGTASGVATEELKGERLKLRDDPRVGVTLPGLLEVEVKSASDVAELIRSLRRTGYGVPGTPHRALSVFTITIEGVAVRKFLGAGTGRGGSPRGGAAGGAAADRTRMSFITLPEVAGSSTKVDDVPAWVRGLHAVLEGMEVRSPTIAFHRTRATLLLRDALVGRVPAAMIAVVSPSIDAAAASGATLKFASRVRTVTSEDDDDADDGGAAGAGAGAVAAPHSSGSNDARRVAASRRGARPDDDDPDGGYGDGYARGYAAGDGGGGGRGYAAGAGGGAGAGAESVDQEEYYSDYYAAAHPNPAGDNIARAVAAVGPRSGRVFVPGDYQRSRSRQDEGLMALTPRRSGATRQHISPSGGGGGASGGRRGPGDAREAWADGGQGADMMSAPSELADEDGTATSRRSRTLSAASSAGRMSATSSAGRMSTHSEAGAAASRAPPSAASEAAASIGTASSAAPSAMPAAATPAPAPAPAPTPAPAQGGGSVDALPTDPLGRAEAIATRMAALSTQGDESAKWFTAMLSALEVSRQETRTLRARDQQTQGVIAELQAQNAALIDRLELAEGELDAAKRAKVTPAHFLQTRALKEKLANARQEIKDYELYKDVMETAVVRLKGEMQRLVDEREGAKKDASRAHAHARKEREQAIKARKRAKAAESELVQQQLSAEDKISRVKASVRTQESNLIAMRDQVLVDNERLLRELQDARDRLSRADRRVAQLESELSAAEGHEGGGSGGNNDGTTVAGLQQQLDDMRGALEAAEESNAVLKRQLLTIVKEEEEDERKQAALEGTTARDSRATPAAPRSSRRTPVAKGTNDGAEYMPESIRRAQNSRANATRAIANSSRVKRGVDAVTQQARRQRSTNGRSKGRGPQPTRSAVRDRDRRRQRQGPGGDRHMYDVTKSVARGVTSRMAASSNAPRTTPPASQRARSHRDRRAADDVGAGREAAASTPIARVAPHHKALVQGLKADMDAMKRAQIPVRGTRQARQQRRRR